MHVTAKMSTKRLKAHAKFCLIYGISDLEISVVEYLNMCVIKSNLVLESCSMPEFDVS